MTTLVNPFEQSGRWYKAALHVHTTTSDGAKTPRQMTAWYRRLGYQIVALTDHFKTNDITGLGGRGFLVISGMEYHPPRAPDPADLHHIVALHVPRDFAFPPASRKNANACIRAVKAVGGASFLAHPYWCHHRFDQYAYLKGYDAVEVFNSTCDPIGRSDSECDWSHQLDAGRILPALAVDDSHGDPDTTGRSCTWLKLPALTPEAVLQAVRTGCGYSSNGPLIEDFRIADGQIILACSPAAAVYFVVHNRVTGAAHYARQEPIRALERSLPADWTCFRAVVVDAAGRKAWSNPMVVTPGDRARARRRQRSKNLEALRVVYPLARQAGRRGWVPLDLRAAANRPLTGENSGFGNGHELRNVAAGRRTIHGVPFRLMNAQENRNRAAIALPCARIKSTDGRAAPREIVVPLAGEFRAVYLLHGAAYVAEHRAVAEYRFVYADGQIDRMPILGMGPRAESDPQTAARANICRIQDWWPLHPQFDQPHAHKVPIASPKDPLELRYLYTTEWINPRPDAALKEIRLTADPDRGALVLVLAATALEST